MIRGAALDDKSAKKDVFEKIIDPTFHQLLDIQRDYRQSFSKTLEMISIKPTSKIEILSNIHGSRGELLEIRQLTRATGQSLMDDKFSGLTIHINKEYQTLCYQYGSEIFDYFSVTIRERNRRSTWFTTLDEQIKSTIMNLADDDIVDSKYLEIIIQDALRSIDENWSHICYLYAQIRKR